MLMTNMLLYRVQQRLDSVLHRKHVIGFSNNICLKGHYIVLENRFKNQNFIIYYINEVII